MTKSSKNRIVPVITLVAVALAGAAVYLFLQPDVQAPQQAQKPPEHALSAEGYERVAQIDAIHRGRTGDASAVAELQAILKSDDTAALTRAGVATILGKLGDDKAVDQLKDALSDSHSGVRAQAAAALGRIGHPMVLPDLIAALDDSVFSVRVRAAYALAGMEYVPANENDKGKYQQVLDAFQKIVSGKGIMADDAYMHLNVGKLHEIDKDYEKALEHYHYALRFAPGLADAKDRTQRLLEEEARYKKVVEILTPVVEKEVRAQVALGLAYIYRGRLQDGVSLLQRAVSAGVRSELVETGLGDAQRKLGNFAMARRHYETALKTGSNFPGAHRGLALLDYTEGNGESGRAHWSQFMRSQTDASGEVKKLMGTP